MDETNGRKNMVMITVALPDASDQDAIVIKKSIEEAVQHIDGASVEMRIRNAKDRPGGIPRNPV